MNRRLLILTSSVVAAHLFLFFFNFKKDIAPPSPKKSIVVRTFTPPPKKPAPVIKKISTSPKPSSPSKPHSSLAPQVNKKKNDLFKEIKESLTKIEKSTHSEKSTALTLPKNIQNLEIDHIEMEEKNDYFILLAETLKNELELPDYGDVKLELTVLHSGRVTKLKILDASSEKNRRYLELKLPKLTLPAFSEDLKNQYEHTFTLTFCNET